LLIAIDALCKVQRDLEYFPLGPLKKLAKSKIDSAKSVGKRGAVSSAPRALTAWYVGSASP
jgi:hypothetical protein